ncbi:MAG: hybrid cluster-associated redox disulfide protein [Patescibacteria group bacterium]|jgi:hybrid cluster-associated redox disulfide protein
MQLNQINPEENSTTQTPERITRDTIVSDILMKNPQHAMLLSEILYDFGIHCVGCEVSSIETIGEGVISHGFSEDQLSDLLYDLNKTILGDPKEYTL